MGVRARRLKSGKAATGPAKRREGQASACPGINPADNPMACSAAGRRGRRPSRPALRVLRSEANDPQSVRPASGYAILPIPLAHTCHDPCR